jgi:hypothetical protein
VSGLLFYSKLVAEVGLGPRRNDPRPPQQIRDEQKDQDAGNEDNAPDGHSEGRERHGSMLPAQSCTPWAGRSRAYTSCSGRSGTILMVRPGGRGIQGVPVPVCARSIE